MGKKILVIVTAGCFLLCLGAMYNVKHKSLPQKTRVPLSAKHYPTIGDPYAPINITVFEEPSCSACREFSTEVYPLIKKHYVDTGIASYTLVPLYFIRGSRPAVEALMCLYHHDPRHPDVHAYIEYFHRLLTFPKVEGTEWATPEVLTRLAEGLPTHNGRTINPEGLSQCVELRAYEEQIKKNNIYASQVLGGELATPTAVVGDYLIEDPTFDEIDRVIKQLRYMQTLGEPNG